jgi:hypothetical protein
MRKQIIFSLLAASLSAPAFAAKHDGSDIEACKGVTDICMAANIRQKK